MSYSISREILYQAADLLVPGIIRSTTTIHGDRGSTSPEHVFLGTGTFLSIDDDIIVLTAMHVVQDSIRYRYVFHAWIKINNTHNNRAIIPCKCKYRSWYSLCDLISWRHRSKRNEWFICMEPKFAYRRPVFWLESFDGNLCWCCPTLGPNIWMFNSYENWART